MYLGERRRRKNGKPHRYWSVVEARRLANGKTAQRLVLYLVMIHRRWFLGSAMDELLGVDWLMGRGVSTEAELERMRGDGIGYLVGAPKAMLDKMESSWLDKPWEQVHEQMQVKLAGQDGEL